MSSSASELVNSAIRDGRAFIAIGLLNIGTVLAALTFGLEANTLELALYCLVGISLLAVGGDRFRHVR